MKNQMKKEKTDIKIAHKIPVMKGEKDIGRPTKI